MESHEVLSQEALVKRLRGLHEATCHLRINLPAENPHAHILRLTDIAAYIGIALNTLHRCAINERRMAMSDGVQRDLSRFFYGWDHGHLVKAKLAGKWIIVNPHAHDRPLSQIPSTQGPQTNARNIAMRIDMTTLGPKLRGA